MQQMDSLVIDQSSESLRVFINGNLHIVVSQEMYNQMERMGLFPEDHTQLVKFLKARALIPLGEYRVNWVKEIDTSTMSQELRNCIGRKIQFDSWGRSLYGKQVPEEQRHKSS